MLSTGTSCHVSDTNPLCHSKVQFVFAWQFLANVGHLLQEGRLHAASAELVHPEGGFVLQGCAARVKGVRKIIVQQAADRSHVEVGETAQAAGKVGGVVAGSEYAAKVRVEEVLGDSPVNCKMGKRIKSIHFFQQ